MYKNLLSSKEINIIKTLLGLDLNDVVLTNDGTNFHFIDDNGQIELSITVGDVSTTLFIYFDNTYEVDYVFENLMTQYDLTNHIKTSIINYLNDSSVNNTNLSLVKNRFESLSLFTHKSSGDLYQLNQLTNATAQKNDYVLTSVYTKIATQEIFSRPMDEFREKFEHVNV